MTQQLRDSSDGGENWDDSDFDDDFDEEEIEKQQAITKAFKEDLQRQADDKAKRAKFGAPPNGFDFSILQEREENGLRLGTFLKPRLSRSLFGLGFQDLGWDFEKDEVIPTPSRLIKIIFNEAKNIPLPGTNYNVHSRWLRYALCDKTVNPGEFRTKGIVSPVFTVFGDVKSSSPTMWTFPHYKDLILSNNPANMRISQQSKNLGLYVELCVNVIKINRHDIVGQDSGRVSPFLPSGDPVVQNEDIHCLSSGWAIIDLDDTHPLTKDDEKTGPASNQGAEVQKAEQHVNGGGTAVEGKTDKDSLKGTGKKKEGAGGRSAVSSVSLEPFTLKPLPTASKASEGKLARGKFVLQLNAGSLLNKMMFQKADGDRSKGEPQLLIEIRDPKPKTKERNMCLPATILYPRQFQPSILTYRRILARRLSKIDAPGNSLIVAPSQSFAFGTDSNDWLFKVFPSIADSPVIMNVFTQHWTHIYKKKMTKDSKRQYQNIVENFTKLAKQVWPLRHLFTADKPNIPPIAPAITDMAPQTAFPMTQNTASKLISELVNCAYVPMEQFCNGIIPAGTPIPTQAKGKDGPTSSFPASAPADTETHAIFLPFRAQELRQNFAEGFLPPDSI
ncbi:hypothetical protein BLNAU_15030 [Blattamonas nauphoetae]|uniref:Uncharacterized protein n=1 Tax=Blattamonas nauphoetae TaxID=2049346 RepID=A0ABQ9XFJ1_9EUKA|nr:hypothetical protein BLNAU_15030 [Blattamonas nauphoetae]